ncbi:MAG: hypothetical protein D3904_06455 [Candidatus Electrothrix sp. EH2]|nr:hypothetical protein [Candidatus Electrothrix sp. EH2]
MKILYRNDYKKEKGAVMSRFVTEASVVNGRLELNNVPFSEKMQVKVVVIPKVDLSKMSFPDIWKTTRGIQGNLADDVAGERGER